MTYADWTTEELRYEYSELMTRLREEGEYMPWRRQIIAIMKEYRRRYHRQIIPLRWENGQWRTDKGQPIYPHRSL